jgi:hypothetical protein
MDMQIHTVIPLEYHLVKGFHETQVPCRKVIRHVSMYIEYHKLFLEMQRVCHEEGVSFFVLNTDRYGVGHQERQGLNQRMSTKDVNYC